MALYFCRNCGMNVEEKVMPSTNGCTVRSSHNWTQIKGNTSFYCRYCHMSVYCDFMPSTTLGGGCSGRSSHSWVRR